MSLRHIHFVTGRLAENALRNEVARLSSQIGFQYSIQVLPISVAALLTIDWIVPRLEIPDGVTELMLPGYVLGDVRVLQEKLSVPVTVGPKDLRELSQVFRSSAATIPLDSYDIEILAEINNAPRLSPEQFDVEAARLIGAGANVIDIGCLPGTRWEGIQDACHRLQAAGVRCSVDSFDPQEVVWATAAGAELVLSVNSTNVHSARDWGCEVVVVPDDPARWESMEETMERLALHEVPFRIDPILEPVGLGFASGLERYFAARRRWPNVPMLMGIGNVTELADVDSAGVNFLLIAICQELKINSVLTTQVINWCRSSVQECDWARRIIKQAVERGIPAKRLSSELVCLRDSRLLPLEEGYIKELTSAIKDRNYRILADENAIHVLGQEDHFEGTDPFQIAEQVLQLHPRNLDPSHAFYLGYELAKAELAMLLGKQYTQDEPLDWGHLGRKQSVKHRLRKREGRNPAEGNSN